MGASFYCILLIALSAPFVGNIAYMLMEDFGLRPQYSEQLHTSFFFIIPVVLFFGFRRIGQRCVALSNRFEHADIVRGRMGLRTTGPAIIGWVLVLFAVLRVLEMSFVLMTGLDQSQHAIDIAWKQYKNDDFANAVESADKVLKLTTGNSTTDSALKTNAHLLRAYSMVQLGNYTIAIQDATSAIEYSPNLASAYYIRGSAHLNNGNSVACIEDCSHAIKLDSNDSDFYLTRSAAYRASGNLEASSADLETANNLINESRKHGAK